MKKFISLVFISFLLEYVEGNAQKGKPPFDSLNYLLDNAKSDTQRVVLLNELAYLCLLDQPQQALQYSHHALALAQKIDYKEIL